MINIRKLEAELWEAADLLRQGSKVTSHEYCMPVLGLIFLRYAFGRFKFVEGEILKNRPVRNGRVLPVEAEDFRSKSAIYLPEEARYEYLVNLPNAVDVGAAINHAMELIEEQSPQLKGILPKNYTILQNELLRDLLRIFNHNSFNEIQDDVIGRIYEYFLNKFAAAVASDDGVFFTPKSLVRMIVNVIEPKRGTVLDPACGSGGMFVASADFIEHDGANANTSMTFYGQEKVEYNAKLCIMNMAVHGLNAKIISGDEANSFYHDAHNLEGCCDYVMANPPFNVDKIKSETTQNAGRLPFGLPGVNKNKEIGNGNYLWISYFYAYLNEKGRAGFVMASSATDSQGKDKVIREQLVQTGDVDVILSVGNNFFYTLSLPCTLWFFDKGKRPENKDKVLFIDARNYYTVIDRKLNEWSPWQLKNLTAIVWLYRGEVERYRDLLEEYTATLYIGLHQLAETLVETNRLLGEFKDDLDGAAKAIYLTTHHNGVEPYTYAEVSNVIQAYQKHYTEQFRKLESYVSKLSKIEAKDYLQKLGEYSTWAACKKNIEKALDNLFRTDVTNLGEATTYLNVIREYEWLKNHFPEGEYADVAGLCKVATCAEIQEKNFSLTPGAYVGVAEVAHDGVDFKERMAEIHAELLTLQAESNTLMETLSNNLKEMGL